MTRYILDTWHWQDISTHWARYPDLAHSPWPHLTTCDIYEPCAAVEIVIEAQFDVLFDFIFQVKSPNVLSKYSECPPSARRGGQPGSLQTSLDINAEC